MIGSRTIRAVPKAPAPAVSNYSGFTLVELMVTIAIIGILAAIALPSFSSLIASTRARGVATDMYVSLVKARSEAVKRNTAVVVKPADAGWDKGWTIAPANAENNVLENHTVSGAVTVSGPGNVRYNSSGRVTGAASFSISATLGDATSERCVSISLSGLPSIKAAAC